MSFAKLFGNTFIVENLLRTGFERRILQKMANRLSSYHLLPTFCYNKEIPWSRQLYQKTDIARESVYLSTIDRKLTLNLIVIFNSFIDISFLKYVTKIFCVSYYSQEGLCECFKEQPLVAVFVYILSSEGANQLQVLYVKTLANIQGNVFTEAAVLKCISRNFFLETCRRFRTTSKMLALENYVLAYHTADKDHTNIL